MPPSRDSQLPPHERALKAMQTVSNAELVGGALKLHFQEFLTRNILDQPAAQPSSLSQTLHSLNAAPDEDVAILPKDKLAKKDIANEADEPDEAADRKFRQERLVLGLQVSSTKFNILTDSAHVASAGKSLKWNEVRAGCDINFCKKEADHCMKQVEAYRQNCYYTTKQRAKADLQVLILNASELNANKTMKATNNFLIQTRHKKKKNVVCVDPDPQHRHVKRDQI